MKFFLIVINLLIVFILGTTAKAVTFQSGQPAEFGTTSLGYDFIEDFFSFNSANYYLWTDTGILSYNFDIQQETKYLSQPKTLDIPKAAQPLSQPTQYSNTYQSPSTNVSDSTNSFQLIVAATILIAFFINAKD